MIVRGVSVSQCVYPLVRQWALGLLPRLGRCEQRCAHGGASVCVGPAFGSSVSALRELRLRSSEWSCASCALSLAAFVRHSVCDTRPGCCVVFLGESAQVSFCSFADGQTLGAVLDRELGAVTWRARCSPRGAGSLPADRAGLSLLPKVHASLSSPWTRLLWVLDADGSETQPLPRRAPGTKTRKRGCR